MQRRDTDGKVITKYSWCPSNHPLCIFWKQIWSEIKTIFTTYLTSLSAVLQLLKKSIHRVVTYLLIDTKYPRLDVCVVVVRNVVNCEDWAIFFGVSTLWPKRWEILL